MLLLAFNKPFNVVCQFRPHGDDETLAQYVDIKNVLPAGRLDKDSEGLLLLTDNGALQHEITQPDKKMKKGYWVQVEGQPDAHALDQLRQGVILKDGKTRPATVQQMNEPVLWERVPPIRERKSIPTSWLDITINEGKNRQIRRMTAAIGYPTLRLVRYRIGPWYLNDLLPGRYESRDIPETIRNKLDKKPVQKGKRSKKRN